MIKDISGYLCSREECLNDIKQSINSYSRKEIISKISHSELCKLDKNIRKRFFECNIDEIGNVFLFDEVSPRLVAKYIIDNIATEVEMEDVYAYVCRIQMKIINEFYKEISLEQRVLRLARNINFRKDYKEKYYGLVEERLKYPIKCLRGR